MELYGLNHGELCEWDMDTVHEILKLYDRTLDSLHEDVDTIRKWLETQPHLPEISDRKICHILMWNKCRIEKTKQKLDNYCVLRTNFPDVLPHPLDTCMLKAAKYSYWCLIPKLTPDRQRVLIGKISGNLPDDADMRLVFAYTMNVVELRMLEDIAENDIYVFDISDVPLRFLGTLTPSLLKKWDWVLRAVFSYRFSQLHIIYPGSYVEVLTNILLAIVKPKVKDRIFVHHNYESLQQKIPKQYLPRDFGGDQPFLDELKAVADKKFLQYKSHFDELMELKVNESLRPERLVNDEVLGYYGNFKKLNVD